MPLNRLFWPNYSLYSPPAVRIFSDGDNREGYGGTVGEEENRLLCL
jgi:hypothetical protein